MELQYDYIITGVGCSGLSLLMRLLQYPQFQQKKILLVDKEPKTSNDRTWCFWETSPGCFEPIVHRRWSNLCFHSSSVNKELIIEPYQYKMIRGIDFYNNCFNEIEKHPNVTVLYKEVRALGNEGNKAFALIGEKKLWAEYIFNSILFNTISPQKNNYLLLQHFKGWQVKTDKPAFDAAKATLMDFRTHQLNETAFFYVMPFSETEALVEYTLFSPSLLEQQQYTAALQEYIQKVLRVEAYSIQHEEFGVIPMTNQKFNQQQGNIIHVGTAGGSVKPSSGYAFQFIQKNSEFIVRQLLNGSSVFTQKPKRKFKYYDSVLLNILSNRMKTGEEIFSTLFESNDASLIFKFLDNETTLQEDINIIYPLTSTAFIKAGFQELLK